MKSLEAVGGRTSEDLDFRVPSWVVQPSEDGLMTRIFWRKVLIACTIQLDMSDVPCTPIQKICLLVAAWTYDFRILIMGEGHLGGELFILLDTVFLTFESSSSSIFMNQHHQTRWTYLAQFLTQFNNKARNMMYSIPKAILLLFEWICFMFAIRKFSVVVHVMWRSLHVLDHLQWNFIGPSDMM